MLSFMYAYNMDILAVRKMFYAAAENEKNSSAFMDYMSKLNEDDPMVKGYTGMAHMLLAKNSINPFTKSTHFMKGRRLLDLAVNSDSNNVELRFLRLTVQIEAPFFLEYSGQVDEDKKVIRTALPQLGDRDLAERIKKFFESRKLSTI